jgi:hypothetical protein
LAKNIIFVMPIIYYKQLKQNKMANIFTATVLQINQYAQPTNGTVFALPSQGIVVSPSTVIVNGVQANALIVVPPSGLNQRSTGYLVTSTVNQVVTAANA